MKTQEKSKELKMLINVLDWISKYPSEWYTGFERQANDCLMSEELITVAASLMKEKQYALFFIFLTINHNSSKMDEMIERTVCKIVAKRLTEEDVNEFGNQIIGRLKSVGSTKNEEIIE